MAGGTSSAPSSTTLWRVKNALRNEHGVNLFGSQDMATDRADKLFDPYNHLSNIATLAAMGAMKLEGDGVSSSIVLEVPVLVPCLTYNVDCSTVYINDYREVKALSTKEVNMKLKRERRSLTIGGRKEKGKKKKKRKKGKKKRRTAAIYVLTNREGDLRCCATVVKDKKFGDKHLEKQEVSVLSFFCMNTDVKTNTVYYCILSFFR
jgi:hypothetical protein